MEDNKPSLSPLFEEDNIRAVDAIGRAQMIAFAPYVWEASSLLLSKGILRVVEEANQNGIKIPEIATKVGLSIYGCRILMEAGLGIGLVYRKKDLYYLAKTGHILLNHEMTKINFNFMRDVCCKGASTLEQSIEASKPLGLKTLGNWNTLYEGLSAFPETANKSWLAFDHFYSDNTFPEILPIIFKNQPKKILDIGGNTGKWTLQCLEYDNQVEMGFVDLKGQINTATTIFEKQGLSNRVTFYEIDMLDLEKELPKGYDAIWMSQFLDCFSETEIVSILDKCYRAADENTLIYINETFWDRQRFATSAFALQMTSLYFTTIANGNSQMYDSEVFLKLIEKANFEIINQQDLIGISHTLLTLKKKK